MISYTPLDPGDVDLAARALYDAERRGPDEPEWDDLSGDHQESYRIVQRAVLSALAAAGRLLPPVVRSSTQQRALPGLHQVERTIWVGPWTPVRDPEGTP